MHGIADESYGRPGTWSCRSANSCKSKANLTVGPGVLLELSASE
jgi:hypothetical protein